MEPLYFTACVRQNFCRLETEIYRTVHRKPIELAEGNLERLIQLAVIRKFLAECVSDTLGCTRSPWQPTTVAKQAT